MRLTTYSDGGARGNPGPAAIGIVVCDAKGKVLKEHSDLIGRATNNVAEYCALVGALALASLLGAREVDVFVDSEVVCRQMTGAYKVKADHLKQLLAAAREEAGKFEKVTYRHVPRTHPMIERADRLVNRALDEAREESL